MGTYRRLFTAAAIAALAFACDGDDDNVDASSPAPPVISMLQWSHLMNCTPGTPTGLTITTTATDQDTPANLLLYSGSVTGCTGTIDSNEDTIICPQIAPYTGSVTVTDPDNDSDTMSFTIRICTDGQTLETHEGEARR